jgi:hypothetical protein
VAIGIGEQRIRVPADVSCGVAALALGALAVWISIAGHGGRLSTMVRMAESDPIAVVVRGDPDWEYVIAHYDGIYFFAIALDPLATREPHTLIDLGANRYGHPAYGWAAGLVGLFYPPWLPLSLVIVGLGSFVAAAIAASRISSLLGWTPWGGLAIAVNPGLIFAVATDTSEAFGAALLCLALWLWLRGRYRSAAIPLVVACFAKEHLLLVPLGLALWESARWVRDRGRGQQSLRDALGRMAFLIPGPLLWIAWTVYLQRVFGEWSFEIGDNLALPFPFVGWFDLFQKAAILASRDFNSSQVGLSSLALGIAALAVIVIAITRAIRFRSTD